MSRGSQGTGRGTMSETIFCGSVAFGAICPRAGSGSLAIGAMLEMAKTSGLPATGPIRRAPRFPTSPRRHPATSTLVRTSQRRRMIRVGFRATGSGRKTAICGGPGTGCPCARTGPGCPRATVGSAADMCMWTATGTMPWQIAGCSLRPCISIRTSTTRLAITTHLVL